MFRFLLLYQPGLCPGPRLGRSRGPSAPLRSLAGALCAPRPSCADENGTLATVESSGCFDREAATDYMAHKLERSGW